MLRAVRFFGLLSIALIMGLAFAHVLEYPGKLRLDGPTWLLVQQNLYIGFGLFGAVVELSAIVLAWALVILLRGRPGQYWSLLAAICVTTGLVEWAIVVAPTNTILNAWSGATLPASWTTVRDRWETGHAIHFALFAIAYCAQLVGLLRQVQPE